MEEQNEAKMDARLPGPEMCLLACAVVGKKESKVLKSCSRRQEGKGLPVGANRSLEASDLLM